MTTKTGDCREAGYRSQRSAGDVRQMLSTNVSVEEMPDEHLPYGGEAGLTREILRESAMDGGYFYRQHSQEEVNMLGPETVRYQKKEFDVASELGSVHTPHHETGVGSGLSKDSSKDDLTGFTGMDRNDIEAEVRLYVTRILEIQGNATPLTVETVMKNIPKLGLLTRRGQEASVTTSFTRNAKLMTPYTNEDDGFISVPEWMRMICQMGDDNAWSLPTRIRFLARTGGLAKDVAENVRQRVIDFMRDPAGSWLPLYEPSRDEGDHRYWLFIWLDVELKIIQEFHTELHQEVIDEGVAKLIRMPKYQWTSQHDPLNQEFYKVALLYQELNNWLIERSSDMVNSPMYVFRLIREWLKEECGPGGKIAAILIDKAVAKLSTDPESVLPPFHMLSPSELREVKRRGKANPTANTYRLILENLKKKAVNKELDYTANSLTLVSHLMTPTSVRASTGLTTSLGAKKKDRKANSVVATDVSSLTLNTTTNPRTSTGKYEICPSCSMFHGQLQKYCPFWDPANRTFKTQNFWRFRSVRKIEADGTSTVNGFWLKKLKQHGFKGMGILEAADQDKIINDLKALAAAAPIASIEERKKWAQQNAKYINLARKEDMGTTTQVSAPVKITASKASSQPSQPKVKSSKKKRSKVEEVDSSSDDFDEDDDMDSDDSVDLD